MARFLLRRLLAAMPTLLVIVTLAFLLLHAAPGGPFDADKRLLPEIQRSIEARYHLDEPLWHQYLRYLADLAHGDLGPSFQYRNTSVNEIIAQGLPVDATIGGCAMLLALLLGVPVGLGAALAPQHALGPPADGAGGGGHLGAGVRDRAAADPGVRDAAALAARRATGSRGSPSHLVLPALALALPYIAYVARLMRGSTLEVLAAPFIRTARAKGLPLRTDRAAPRAAADAAAAGVLPRPRDRRRAHRLDRGRERVRPARHRPLSSSPARSIATTRW